MKKLQGGIEVAGGVYSAGINAGIKATGAKDLALIYFPDYATITGVFTKNRVFGHHVKFCRDALDNFERFKALIINSGNANALNGLEGYEDIGRIVRNISSQMSIDETEVLMASTGTIGERLQLKTMDEGFAQAIELLDDENSEAAAEAILTTDSRIKQTAYTTTIGDQEIRIGGMVKGTRMIDPNMGTMIGVITTNLALPQAFLKRQLIHAVNESFNKMTVDGNTSPNDSVFLCSTEEVEMILSREVLDTFSSLLVQVCQDLSYMVVSDSEESTKTIEVEVLGAMTKSDATKVAREIASSSLVKRSFFENFPDTGRIMAASGRNPEVTIIPHVVSVDVASKYGSIRICNQGQNVFENISRAREIIDAEHVKISLDLNIGDYSSSVWTCDFSSESTVN